jgi:hypothetical protein
VQSTYSCVMFRTIQPPRSHAPSTALGNKSIPAYALATQPLTPPSHADFVFLRAARRAQVHCNAGLSRSAAVVVAHVMESLRMCAGAAPRLPFAHRRPSARVRVAAADLTLDRDKPGRGANIPQRSRVALGGVRRVAQGAVPAPDSHPAGTRACRDAHGLPVWPGPRVPAEVCG